jgi:SAM-dependent methyltransferase
MQMTKAREPAEPSQAANAAQAKRWNGASGQYWIAHRERHLAEHQHLKPHLLRAAGISPGERVIDVGCGCGDMTIASARAAVGNDAEPGWAVGLDLSAPMLEVASQLAAQADVGNVGFVQGDAQAGPLRQGAFDVAISKFGVMFFDSPHAAFTSLAASIRPAGRLAFLCWQDDKQNEVFAIPVRAMTDCTKPPAPGANDLFTDPDQITDLLSSSGWADIRVTSVIEPAWMGSDVDDVMKYIRGVAEILGEEEDFERTLAHIAADYAQRQRPDGVWVRAAAWLVTARRA